MTTKVHTCFLVFDRYRVKAMRLNRPSLRAGERSVCLRVTVPLALFDGEIPVIEVEVPTELVTNGVTAAVDGPTMAAVEEPTPLMPDPADRA